MHLFLLLEVKSGFAARFSAFKNRVCATTGPT